MVGHDPRSLGRGERPIPDLRPGSKIPRCGPSNLPFAAYARYATETEGGCAGQARLWEVFNVCPL
jgi:hypothetical protein